MIRLTEHTRDMAVFVKDSAAEPWFDCSKKAVLELLGRKKSNIGDIEVGETVLRVSFLRCRGAENLQRKLLRRVAEHKFPNESVATQSAMAEVLHEMFKDLHNGGRTTSKLKPSEFKVYYDHCQRDCCRVFGITGMDEDDKEFDHGFPT